MVMRQKTIVSVVGETLGSQFGPLWSPGHVNTIKPNSLLKKRERETEKENSDLVSYETLCFHEY